MPRPFRLVRLIAEDATVRAGGHFKLKVPAEILLSGSFSRFKSSVPQPLHHPLRQVVTEAAIVDEVVPHFGRIED